MVRPLNFQQVQVFKMVMETGTTTKAAAALNTTQPSISRKLTDLQRAAGIQLFEHHHGRLRPTREGRQLYQSVRKHFEGLEKIETAVAILRKSGTGVLRLGSTPTLATGLLPAILARFMQQFPGTHISLQTLATPQLEELLQQGLIDLALTTGTIDQSVFETSILARAGAVCIMPPMHALAREPWIALNALRQHRLLLLDDSDTIVVRMRELLAGDEQPEDIAVATNSSITICALVAAGVGIGVVNPYVASRFADSLLIKELRPSPLVDVQMARSMTLAPSLLGNAFTELLRQEIQPPRP